MKKINCFYKRGNQIMWMIGFLFFCLQVNAQTANLIINEVSQGNGAQEYVELLVVSDQPNSCIRPTLDIRKWVIDDNNGFFKSGNGSGIATGSMRFADNVFWSQVPVGTLILIYNATDYNSSVIPAVDVSLSDNNCRLVIPSTSNLLEKNPLPTVGNGNYPTTGWTANGDWSTVGMRNAGDAFQIRRPDDLSVPVHSVSYGDNTANQDIYFSGAAGGKVYSFLNTFSDNYHDQANWGSANVGGNETPGAPNGTNNQVYINVLSNNCLTTPPSASMPEITATVVQNTTCNKPNGSVQATVSGGTAPFSYEWSNGDNSPSINDLQAGNYEVIVTDAAGCKDTAQVSVATSSGPHISLTPTPTTCGLNNGEIASAVSGGATPYVYQWNSGQTSANLQNIGSGSFQVIVTDQNNCKDTATTLVNASTPIAVDTILLTSTSCGLNNGKIQVNGINGTAPYVYSWSNGASGTQIYNIASGNYTVTVTDAKNCSTTANFAIAGSSSPQVQLNIAQPATCGQANGKIQATISGGTTPYQLLWSNGATTNPISNLAPGTYSLTVTDANGCSKTSSAQTLTNQGGFTISEQITQPTCTIPTGNIVVSVNGGTQPISYNWSNGNTTNHLSNVAPGTYSVTITDGSNCTDTQSYSIVAPTPIDFTVQTEKAACGQADGSVTVSILQGNGPFTYLFSNGQTGSSVNNFPAGQYSVTVSNNDGCSKTENFSITQYSTVDVTINATSDVLNVGDSAILSTTIDPANNTYSYTWSPDSSVSCATCPTTQIQPTTDTWYYVQVVSSNGCSGKDSIRIFVKEDCGDVYIPSIFSPNGDGNNDYFTVYGKCIEAVDMFIYDRWGNLLYRSDDFQLGWDGTFRGKHLNPGVYVYRMDVTLSSGKTETHHGSVTLVE